MIPTSLRNGQSQEAIPATSLIFEIMKFATFRKIVGASVADLTMQLLRERIERFAPSARIGRVGRTTIEVTLPHADRTIAQKWLDALLPLLETRVRIDGAYFDPRIVAGLTRTSGDDAEDVLFDHAAAALEYAREARLAWYWAEDLDVGAQAADLTLLRDLAEAIEGDGLELFYQPKLDTRANRISALEALLRWPGRGVPVDIERLIRLAEDTGLIRDLTDWVLRRALRDQAHLAEGGHDLRIDINISGAVLPDPTFAARAIAQIGAVPRIGLEITETAVIADPESALANLRTFAQAGIRIAIDDYGSGLSSLAYLKQLPAQELKIDRMFVSGLTNSQRDPLLVRSSIDLAHALEMEITAEGVDDPMALSLLRIMGCDLVQGYLIAPPLPYGELVVFLRDEEKLASFDQHNLAKRLELRQSRVG